MKYIYLFCLLFFLSACEKEIIVDPAEKREEYRVAVVLPLSGGEQAYWERSINWAIENLNAAQDGTEGVRIAVEWFDEATADLPALAAELNSRKDICAIIGPLYSGHTRIFARECIKTRKPLVMMSSSEELIRAYSSYSFLWSLAETDISQCEVLLARAMDKGAKSVALLAADDLYGQTFIDWVGFQAKELGVQLRALRAYTPGASGTVETDMAAALASGADMVICAPSSSADAAKMVRVATRSNRIHRCLFADIAFEGQVLEELGTLAEGMEGVAIGSDPASGFDIAYRVRYGETPSLGAAHFYDAVMLVGLAAVEHQLSGEAEFNACIKRIVNGDVDSSTGSIGGSVGSAGWQTDGLRRAITAIGEGRYPRLEGASGPFVFDSEVYSSVLSSVYYHWQVYNGTYLLLDYCSSDPARRVGNTLSSWNWKATHAQSFQDITFHYPAYGKTYALLVCTSKGWENYRHEADLYRMYRLLRSNGFADEDIILISEDDIANHALNNDPGVLQTSPDGENVYIPGCVDYRLSEARPGEWNDLLKGGPGDNLLVYWVGHGAMSGPMWGDEMLAPQEIADALGDLSDRGGFRKLLFVMESCYAGLTGRACEGIPGVMFLTASNSTETSKAQNYSPEHGVWMSNVFSNNLLRTLEGEPDIRMRDLYYELYNHTIGSHVTVYNQQLFDNLYTTTMKEFTTPGR